MSFLKKCFRHAFRADDVMSFTAALMIYLGLGVAGMILFGCLGLLFPVLGRLAVALLMLTGLYMVCGTVLTLLYYFGILRR